MNGRTTGVAAGNMLVRCEATKTAAGTCQVSIDGLLTDVHVARDLTPAVGDMLLVHRVGAVWVASCRVFPAAAEATPMERDPIDPAPATVTGTLTLLPTYTGSYRGGAWRDDTSDLYQGVRGGYGNSTGSAFYGDKPATLTGATVTAARVLMRRIAGPAAATAPTLWLMTDKTPPAGAPTLTLSTAGPSLELSRSTTFALPTSWGQALADGTAGGLAVQDGDGDPWLGYAGRGTDASAFTLALDWTRTT